MLSLMRLPLAIAAVLSLSLTLCISIMRAMPYKTTDLLATFSPPDDCLRPCWAYIRPGLTTTDEVLALLDERAWVGQVDSDDFWIHWDWEGAPPPMIDPSVPGGLLLGDGRVAMISLASSAALGDFMLAWGTPRWISTWHSDRQAEIILTYPAEYLTLTVRIPCPITRKDFWQARPLVKMQPSLQSSTLFIAPLTEQSFSC